MPSCEPIGSIDEVWADEVETKRNTVQSKVTRLRRALGDPTLIVGAADGYRLAVDRDQVDAFVVARDAVASARLLLAGDLRGAADLSASALALSPGEILPTAGDAEWVEPNRARFDEITDAADGDPLHGAPGPGRRRRHRSANSKLRSRRSRSTRCSGNC